MNIYKKSLCTLFAVLIGTLLFAEQNWWEEKDFSYTNGQTKYEQIFSTRNDNKITEAKIIALMKEK